MTETATATTIRSTIASRENSMNERIAHWKQVNSVKPIPAAKAQAAVKAAEAVTKATKEADMELPPAAVTIDSDESWCTDDSAPFPLPLEQLDKYPVEQRKQQQKANRFYNFFERYALQVSEAGAGLCGSSGNAAADVDEGTRNISIFDDSSVCAEDATGGTDGTTPEKKVHWDRNATSCNDVDYGDFYDRYMLVVTEVGASCGSKDNASKEGDQAGARSVPAGALDKKSSPTSTTETDQVDSSKEQVESLQEEGWDVNQVICMDIDMQPCVGMVKAVPFNLNKFWESLIDKNTCDEDDDVDEDQAQTRSDRKRNSKRMKARESSTLSREIDEDEEPNLDLDMGHSVLDTSVVNLDDVNVMMDSVIDTVLSNEVKGMATEFMGKVRSFVNEDGCPAEDRENETVTSDNDAVNKHQ